MKGAGKPSSSPSRRGRPRSEVAKQAILRAARALLAEGGPGAVTMEAVATRAEVGKPTVYRWWPDRHAVTMAALMELETPESEAARRHSALRALRAQLEAIVSRFATPTGRHITSLIAASDPESELSKAFRNHFVLARRAEGKALLERAIASQEVRADLDLELVLDLLYGPIFFRLLIGHAALDAEFVPRLLDELGRGIARPKRARRVAGE